MHLQQGTLLQGGKYRIERVLGQGSFGITYLAIHNSLERKVAIKEFFMKELNTRGEDGSVTGMTDGSLSFNYGQKFKKEAINLSRLDHPNIVRAIDSFKENGTYYYVMDYVDGENLNDYLKHNTISQQEAVRIIREVANALLYMHETHHMLHLDLKPGNIMRRASDGHIFLIDFGLSKHYGSDGEPETTTSIGLGTPGYAPPEQGNQTRKGETRPSIDVYALGATLYKLLTGETPPHSSEIISDDELVADRLRVNGITDNLIDVVVNAMLPNVKKRIQNVSVFIEALASGSSQSKISDSSAQDSSNVEAKVVNEETIIIGQEKSPVEKIVTIKTQPFNIDHYEIPSVFSTDSKYTEERALTGSKEAMFALAIMYLRGESKIQDYDAAYRWLSKCKSGNDGRALALLNNWEFLKRKYKKGESVSSANTSMAKGTESESKKGSDGESASSCMWIILFFVVVAVIIYSVSQCNNDNIASPAAEEADTVCCDTGSVYVDFFRVENDGSGNCYYWTGYVCDSLPDGIGRAQYITDDSYGRKEYKGNMSSGKRDGKNAILTYVNGDTYEGSFLNDHLSEGTYYCHATGEKFIGTFVDDRPYNGNWYNKKGIVLATVNKGR